MENRKIPRALSCPRIIVKSPSPEMLKWDLKTVRLWAAKQRRVWKCRISNLPKCEERVAAIVKFFKFWLKLIDKVDKLENFEGVKAKAPVQDIRNCFFKLIYILEHAYSYQCYYAHQIQRRKTIRLFVKRAGALKKPISVEKLKTLIRPPKALLSHYKVAADAVLPKDVVLKIAHDTLGCLDNESHFLGQSKNDRFHPKCTTQFHSKCTT